jgi:hypothetical protein
MGLFGPLADTALRAATALVAVAPLGGIAGLIYLARSPLGTGAHEPIHQPLQFDHRHHVSDDGIGCRYCHEGAWVGAHAGVPPMSRCMGCHAQVWNDSPQLSQLREGFFQGEPIRWNRVHRLPDFVFFNHAVHVRNGVACERCHGTVENMAEVEQVAPLTMGFCVDCHRESRGAVTPRTECTTCHR